MKFVGYKYKNSYYCLNHTALLLFLNIKDIYYYEFMCKHIYKRIYLEFYFNLLLLNYIKYHYI